MNNAITGYKKPHSFFGGGHVVDSGKISNKDFQQFYEHMTAVNKTLDTPPTHAATSPEQKKAVADMLMGKADQPEIKRKNTMSVPSARDCMSFSSGTARSWMGFP